MGERIKEAVGGGVVGLSRASDDAGERRKEDKRSEVAVARERVEVEGGVELGRENAVEALGCHVGEESVVERGSGVNDSGQRVVIGDGVQEGLQSVRVCDIASSECDVCAGLLELRHQLSCTGCGWTLSRAKQ